MKVTRAPPSMSRTTWSCFSGAGCGWWKAPSLGAGDQQPARHAEMQDQRLAPVEVGEQVLGAAAERRSRARPVSRSARPRRERPAQVGAADLGASDHAGRRAPARGRGGPSRPPAVPATPPPRAVAARPTCLIRSGGTDRKTEPAHGRASRTTHFGFETVPEAEKAGRVHGVFASVAGALRPDERRDEPRRPPALEGRAARLAGAAARDAAARRGGRHRRHRLPLPAAGARRRARDRARHDRGHARRGPPARRGARASPTAIDWVVGRRDGAALRRRAASTPTRSPSASGT